MISRFILLIVPSFTQTTQDFTLSPLIPIGALCIGGYFLVTYCPETLGKPLNDYIKEEEDMLISRELDEY